MLKKSQFILIIFLLCISYAYAGAPGADEKVSQKGALNITVKSNDILVDTAFSKYKYVVKLKRTRQLNGENVAMEIADERTGSSELLKKPLTFYFKKYGYYEVECNGYDNNSKRIFHMKSGNIKHAGKSTHIAISQTTSTCKD
ncbi:MAG: hypothetical protein KAW12_25825 [Candidatus Aminicenantes bacterium]|nr:hypothetical protein [Candidatus Aminicenantes bacterium]